MCLRSGQSSITVRALSTCSWSSATSTLAPEFSRMYRTSAAGFVG